MSNQALSCGEKGAESSFYLDSQIGIDLGGTSLNIGRVSAGQILQQILYPYDAQRSEQDIINFIIDSIESVIDPSVTSIGIGVPSVVDTAKGVVFEAANIPAWKEVPLKAIIEDHFHIPVAVNNDVNCFVLGEHSSGVAKDLNNVVGICLGTGLGVGLLINGQLYAGNTCGAGELGETSYKNGILEHYCSGQFFKRLHATDGKRVFLAASRGDVKALAILHELGRHVGSAISMCLLAYDPQIVVLGGSVAKAHPYFMEGVRETLRDFPFPIMLERCRIEISQTEHVAVLGAAALIV